MKNDSQFVVRVPKEDLEKFNNILKEKAINRSELFRIWIKKFIEENEKKVE
jgi:metal-responsive CopG/Arc/MetJ family transcriptional regulator